MTINKQAKRFQASPEWSFRYAILWIAMILLFAVPSYGLHCVRCQNVTTGVQDWFKMSAPACPTGLLKIGSYEERPDWTGIACGNQCHEESTAGNARNLCHRSGQDVCNIAAGVHQEANCSLGNAWPIPGLRCQVGEWTPCPAGSICTEDNWDDDEEKTDRWTNAYCVYPNMVDFISFIAHVRVGAIDLVWRTGSEVDTLGFNVYRAEVADGPYTKVNDVLVRAQGAVIGARYTFADQPGAGSFYYKLEKISLNNEGEVHGPVKVEMEP